MTSLACSMGVPPDCGHIVHRREACQLFIDLDGVLADFDAFHALEFGSKPGRSGPEPPEFWSQIARHGRFFLDMPPMPDALALWKGAKQLHSRPVILSGLPEAVPDAEDHKRRWVERYLGTDVPVICCRARDKWLHGQHGDVLIDD